MICLALINSRQASEQALADIWCRPKVRENLCAISPTVRAICVCVRRRNSYAAVRVCVAVIVICKLSLSLTPARGVCTSARSSATERYWGQLLIETILLPCSFAWAAWAPSARALEREMRLVHIDVPTMGGSQSMTRWHQPTHHLTSIQQRSREESAADGCCCERVSRMRNCANILQPLSPMREPRARSPNAPPLMAILPSKLISA